MHEILRQIGLTDAEINVYLALLEIGSSATGPIVKKSRTASSKVYEVLEKLSNKGLVSYVTISGVKHFEAASPTRLLDYIKEKEIVLHEQTMELEKVIPSLQQKQQDAEPSEVMVFRGIKGAESAFNDILSCKKNEEVLIMGHTNLDEIFQKFLLRFHKKRSREGIHARMLWGPDLSNFANAMKLIPHTKVKLYSQGFESQAATITYRDNTLYSLPKDSIWIKVHNARLSEANRNQFEGMWHRDVQVLSGKIGIKTLLEMCLQVKVVKCWGMQGGLRRYSKRLFEDFFKESEKRSIVWKYLCDPLAKEFESEYLQRSKGLVSLKYMTNETQSPTVVWLFGENVAHVVWKDEPTVMIIHNKEVSSHFDRQFEYAWQQDSHTMCGISGIKELLDLVIKTRKDLYFIGANGKLLINHPKMYRDFNNRRVNAGITRHMLVDDELRKHPFVKDLLSEVRFLPKHIASPMVIWVFGNFVAQVLWNQPETVFLTECEQVANDYRRYFQLLWDHAQE